MSILISVGQFFVDKILIYLKVLLILTTIFYRQSKVEQAPTTREARHRPKLQSREQGLASLVLHLRELSHGPASAKGGI